jgi:hypothetical protein
VNLGAYGTTLWSLISLLRNEGDLEFINDGSGWQLAWLSPLNVATTVYSVFQNYSQAGEIHRMRLANLPANAYPVAGIRDLDLSSPGQGTGTSRITNPILNSAFVHTADTLIKWTQTTVPSASQTQIAFRGTTFVTSNHWLAQVNSAGNLHLFEGDGAGGYTQRGTWAGPVVNGDTISILAQDASIQVFVSGTLRISYAAATAYKSQLAGKVLSLGTGGVLATLTAKTLDGIAQRAVTALVDHGGNSLNGAPTKVAFVGTPSKGGQYDGATSYTNIYSAGLDTLFDGDEGTLIVRQKVANAGVWADGLLRRSISLSAGANYIVFEKRTVVNAYRFRREATTSKLVDITISDTDWFTTGLTWSLSADELKAFLNGTQQGATQTDLVAFSGALSASATVIGASSTTPANPWSGSIQDAIISNVVASPADQATINTALAAGTLTHALLDSIFLDRANYVWYDHKERRWLNDGVTVSSNYPGVGLATSVLPGPLAVGDAFTHEADGMIEFQLDVLPSSGDIYVFFRQQDASNVWRIRITSAGTFILDEIVGGSATPRINVVGVLTGGERLVCDFRDTTIKLYHNTTLDGSYASAANFKTETDGSVKSLGTGGRISNLLSWPASPAGAPLTLGASSINAALTAMGA